VKEGGENVFVCNLCYFSVGVSIFFESTVYFDGSRRELSNQGHSITGVSKGF
jgi:hypothetical protein